MGQKEPRQSANQRASEPSSQLGRRHLAMSSLGRLSAVASAVKASALPSPRRIINRSYFSSRLKYQNVNADSDQQAMTICSCRTRRCGWRQATCHMHLCVLVCVCVCVAVLLATLGHHSALDDRVTDFGLRLCNRIQIRI